MGIYVLLTVMLILLVHRQVLGAYPLESDVSIMTGVEPPKKWLVFLEAHILRCMKLRQQPPARSEKDLLSIFRCLGIILERPVRCYFSEVGLYHWFISPNILGLKAPNRRDTDCQKKTGLNLYIFVHQMFHINLTLTNFFLDSVPGGEIYRRNCNCISPTFVVSFNNHSDVYCRTRYPGSILINSNRTEVGFSIDIWSTSTHIIGVVEVMDRYFVQSPLGLHTQDLITWGDFNVRIYSIKVDMLYQIEISLALGSHVIIHDGPSLQMPQLSPYEPISNQSRYISSTFQVTVVTTFRSRNISSQVRYQGATYSPGRKLIPTEHISIKNNSGCGNSSARSWMCTFKIISPGGTQASVEMIRFSMTGAYAYTYLSAGLALYNVINNASNLIVHLFYGAVGLDQRSLSFTASENILYMSVYAYFPYTLLSLTFIAQANDCIGKFIGKLLRPPIPTTLYNIDTSPVYNISKVHLHINLNITRQCYIIYVNVLPEECTLHRYKLHFYLKHNSIVSLHSSMRGSGVNIHVFGKYQLIGDSRPTCLSYCEVIGDIRVFTMERSSSFVRHPIAAVTLTAMECLQPCRGTNSTIPGVQRMVEMCDVCKYMWLNNSVNATYFVTVPNECISLESIYGDRLAAISISSVSSRISGGHEIWYTLRAFTSCFRQPRVFKIRLSEGQLWRTPREALVSGAEFAKRHSPMITHHMFYRKGYEYILVEMPLVRSKDWSSYDIQCGKYDATFLTIEDYQELRFVVRRVMQPLEIERIYISQQYKVCRSRMAPNR